MLFCFIPHCASDTPHYNFIVKVKRFKTTTKNNQKKQMPQHRGNETSEVACKFPELHQQLTGTAPEPSFTCPLCFVKKTSNNRAHMAGFVSVCVLSLCVFKFNLCPESYLGLLVTTRWKGQISIFTKQEIKLFVWGDGYIVPLVGILFTTG